MSLGVFFFSLFSLFFPLSASLKSLYQAFFLSGSGDGEEKEEEERGGGGWFEKVYLELSVSISRAVSFSLFVFWSLILRGFSLDLRIYTRWILEFSVSFWFSLLYFRPGVVESSFYNLSPLLPKHDGISSPCSAFFGPSMGGFGWAEFGLDITERNNALRNLRSWWVGRRKGGKGGDMYS